MATPAKTTAYRSFFSNQPVRGAWCDLCQPQPKPCMTYLCATMEKISIATTVSTTMSVLSSMWLDRQKDERAGMAQAYHGAWCARMGGVTLPLHLHE